MREQRIDTGADAATSTDADPGEGQGTAAVGSHVDPLNPRGASGDDAGMPQPSADRPRGGADPAGGAETEGASYLQDTQAKQDDSADLGGRLAGRPGSPGGSGSSGGGGSGSSGGSASTGGSGASGPEPGRQPATAETGEVTAPPSTARRAENPGSVATEFGDRADEAPDIDEAHPSI